MSKSKFVIDKLTKLFEQGLISYKDLSNEILNILRSKRDELVFKLKLASKEEIEVLNNRIENLEKRLKKIEKKIYKGKEILTLNPLIGALSKIIFPPCDFIISEVIDNPRPTLDFVSVLPLSIL